MKVYDLTNTFKYLWGATPSQTYKRLFLDEDKEYRTFNPDFNEIAHEIMTLEHKLVSSQNAVLTLEDHVERRKSIIAKTNSKINSKYFEDTLAYYKKELRSKRIEVSKIEEKLKSLRR